MNIKKAGILLTVIGIGMYFIIPESFQWISGAMVGGGLGMALFFGGKKEKNTRPS